MYLFNNQKSFLFPVLETKSRKKKNNNNNVTKQINLK